MNAAKVLYLKPVRLKATGVTGEARHWWRPRPQPKSYTALQIEQAVLNSQRLKIEAYKQARKALEKPFSI